MVKKTKIKKLSFKQKLKKVKLYKGKNYHIFTGVKPNNVKYNASATTLNDAKNYVKYEKVEKPKKTYAILKMVLSTKKFPTKKRK